MSGQTRDGRDIAFGLFPLFFQAGVFVALGKMLSTRGPLASLPVHLTHSDLFLGAILVWWVIFGVFLLTHRKAEVTNPELGLWGFVVVVVTLIVWSLSVASNHLQYPGGPHEPNPPVGPYILAGLWWVTAHFILALAPLFIPATIAQLLVEARPGIMGGGRCLNKEDPEARVIYYRGIAGVSVLAIWVAGSLHLLGTYVQ